MRNKNKKLLVLGGTYSQVSLIKYAKKIGFNVITAGNCPNDIGHKYSDTYYNISTTNTTEILKLAVKLKIDVISSFASDPGALTAAYVGEKMGLVSGSIKAVTILSDKALFRKFLVDNGFNSPWYYKAGTINELIKKYDGEKAVLKPVDSSGSKGVFIINNKLDLKKNFKKAKEYSKTKKVILEKFIEKKGVQIHGEGFVLDGKVVFIYLGDQYFDQNYGIIPYSTIVPTIEHEDINNDVQSLIQKVVLKLGYKTGGLNIEVIRDKNDNLYLLELGARNGGNFMPELMKVATGFDLTKANLDFYIKNQFKEVYNNKIKLSKNYFAQLILHSNSTGYLKSINIPKNLIKCIVFKVLYYNKGEIVNKYNNSRDVIGVVIFNLKMKSLLTDYFYYLIKNEWIEVSQLKLN